MTRKNARVCHAIHERSLLRDRRILTKECTSVSPLPTSEVQSHFVRHENSERIWPIRPPGSLRPEGELLSKTETAEKFIEYILGKRRGLIRNSTHLKMEGDMQNKTETGEQFIAMEMQPRPPLVKKFTNLHLEGEMDFDTDYNKTFVPYELEKRPALVKRSTNLKLEGGFEHKPEYMQSYVEFKREKSDLSRPRNNLKVEGNLEASTENMLKFVSHDTSPTIPFLRGGEITKTLMFDGGRCPRHPEYAENYVKHPVERSTPFKRSSQFHLGEVRQRGNIDFNAEYKNAYVDYHKHGNISSPTRRRRTYSQINLPEGPMETYPEYKRSFVDFPRNRPILKKPQQHLFYEGEMDHLTEKRAQYIEYPHYGRTDSMKRDQEFKLDGEFECLPEYRKAYVDYLTRERYERKARPLDSLRAAEDEKSFEVLPAPEDPKKAQKPRPKTGKTGKPPVVVPVSSKEAKPTPPKSSTTEDDTKPSTEPPTTETPTTETQTTEDDSKKKKPPLKSSTLPRSKARKKSISKLETKLFGPKVELKTRSSSSSRLSTPLPPKAKAKVKSKKVESDDELHRESRTGCIYDRKALAEDLAYNPVKSPIPTKKLYSSLAKKSNIRMGGKTAFYVLEDEDINNNHDGYRSAVKDSFQREQKWMPSWHSP